MAASIMPIQLQRRQTGRLSLVENTFQILFMIGNLVVVRVIVDAAEEVGRRQLFGVADDDGLFPACDRADGVPGRDLRRFVKDDHVECRMAGGQILSDRQRRHHQTRGQFAERFRHRLDDLANRFAGTFQTHLMSQQPQFRTTGNRVRFRQTVIDRDLCSRGGCRASFVVPSPKFLDDGFMLEPSEGSQNLRSVDGFG